VPRGSESAIGPRYPDALGLPMRSSSVPKYHNDPFDRMPVAQAQAEGLTLVTADKLIPLYAVTILHTD
jgi:PIN domain nuclease of toxin-antitoxin system